MNVFQARFQAYFDYVGLHLGWLQPHPDPNQRPIPMTPSVQRIMDVLQWPSPDMPAWKASHTFFYEDPQLSQAPQTLLFLSKCFEPLTHALETLLHTVLIDAPIRPVSSFSSIALLSLPEWSHAVRSVTSPTLRTYLLEQYQPLLDMLFRDGFGDFIAHAYCLQQLHQECSWMDYSSPSPLTPMKIMDLLKYQQKENPLERANYFGWGVIFKDYQKTFQHASLGLKLSQWAGIGYLPDRNTFEHYYTLWQQDPLLADDYIVHAIHRAFIPENTSLPTEIALYTS